MNYYFHASYVNTTLIGIKFSIYPLRKHEFSSNKLNDSNFIPLFKKGYIKVAKCSHNNVKLRLDSYDSVDELHVERSEKKWVDPKNQDKVNGKKVHTRCLTKLPKQGHAQVVKFRKDNVELSVGLEKISDEKKWVDPKTREEVDGCGSCRGKKVHARCSRKWVNPKSQDKVHTRCLTKWELYGGCTPLILRALENVSDLDEAFKPWEGRISKKGISVILKEQVNWERAMEIFEWFKMKGCYKLNVIHYNIMFKILGKAQKWGELDRLWDEMRNKKIKPINSSYGTLIDVFSKGGLKEEALVWLQKMNEQGLEVDEVTMGIVVQMYKKTGEFKKAEEYFKMWSFKKSCTSRGTRFCLSLNTYNNLIDTYGKAGKLREAVNTFKEMVRNGIIPDIVTFNTMIHVYGNLGMLEQVNETMQLMEDLERTPDTRTFSILVSLYAKRGDINLAYSYFTKMKESSLKPDPVSYRVLLHAFCIRQMVVEVEMLISEMDENDINIDEFTQSTLTRMYIDANMLSKSWSWFERFHLKGNMSSECYSANIDAYGERGYIDLAEKVFLCCQKRKKISVVEFNVMIKAYGISKKFDKACKLFDTMETRGVLPDKCSYISLIQPLALADLPHIAKPCLMKMQEVGLVDDCVPYTALISSFAKLGHLDLAGKLYKEMIQHQVKPDVILFGVLINAYAESGNVEEVRNCVNGLRMVGFSLNEVICNSLIKLYTKVGLLEEAEEIYRLSKLFETGINIYSSNCMIDLYSERSMVIQAEEVFGDLIRRGEANEFSYAMMLCMYRKIEKIEEALKIAGKMQELSLLTEVLSYNNVLALFAAEDGKFKAVVDLFNEMIELDVKLDDYTFKSLGLVLMKSGVSKQVVARLEVARKKDGLNGLQAWLSALTSVVNGEYYDD